jgi:hypothetical protein
MVNEDDQKPPVRRMVLPPLPPHGGRNSNGYTGGTTMGGIHCGGSSLAGGTATTTTANNNAAAAKSFLLTHDPNRQDNHAFDYGAKEEELLPSDKDAAMPSYLRRWPVNDEHDRRGNHHGSRTTHNYAAPQSEFNDLRTNSKRWTTKSLQRWTSTTSSSARG